MSPLKLVIWPLVGRNEKTAFAPFEPVKRFLITPSVGNCFLFKTRSKHYHVCPARLMFDTVGTGAPVALYELAIGPALMFASQIMISFTLFPVGVDAVNRSYATSVTTDPVVE